MIVRIEYEERTRRMVDVEVTDVEHAQALWRDRDDWFVDLIDGESVEIDGGEDLDSAEFKEVPSGRPAPGA